MKKEKPVWKRPDDLQNIFTAYLSKAVHRRRAEYLHSLAQHQRFEAPTDEAALDEERGTGEEWIKGLPLWMRIESDALLSALKALSDRERAVLLARVLGEIPFWQIAGQHGMSCKGTAAIYYRAVQKIRKQMGEQSK